MSTDTTPPSKFVFADGLDVKKIRSLASREVHRQKRIQQVRAHQTFSSTRPSGSQSEPESLPIAPLATQRRLQWSNEGKSWASDANTYSVAGDETQLPGDRTKKRPTSPLSAIERELVHTDPFNTLPCKLNRSNQNLVHLARSLFLHCSPSWASVKFTEDLSLRLAFSHKLIFCAMLTEASSYLDLVSHRESSLETLQWSSACTTYVNRTISDPGIRYSDEGLVGVLLLLSNDLMANGGKNSHIHSRALTKLLRSRGGLESLQLSHSMDLFVSFVLITPIGEGQIAYLDHSIPEADEITELADWDRELNLLVLTFNKLHQWDRGGHVRTKEAEQLEISPLSDVTNLLPAPKDKFEEAQELFIHCYLVATQWDYRQCPRVFANFLRKLLYHCRNLGCNRQLANIAWILVQGLDGNRHRKWQVLRQMRVIYRLSRDTRSKINNYLHSMINPRLRHAQKVLLTPNDFTNIRYEAFAGLRVDLLDSHRNQEKLHRCP